MKNFLAVLITIALALAAWQYRGDIVAWLSGEQQQGVQAMLEQARQDVLAPPPLRSTKKTPAGTLTVSGVIRETNAQRQANGSLGALKENLRLNEAAQRKVSDMFEKQYFEHVSPTGADASSLAKAAGYEYVMIGENLALGNFKDDADLVEAWMGSPGHRANILNTQYLEIGVAVGKGMFEGKQVWLAVQEFGRPLSDCPQVSSLLKNEIDGLNREIREIQPQIEAIKRDLQRDPQTKEDAVYYNRQVAQYNDMVRMFNNNLDRAQQLTELYNGQVREFNACVER